jgi:hypothetical protein
MYPLKFLVFFLPNSAVFDVVEKPISQKIKVWDLKKVIVGSWSYFVVNQPQKITVLQSLGSRRL